jgi:Mrp family chromosome partitioning ATPase
VSDDPNEGKGSTPTREGIAARDDAAASPGGGRTVSTAEGARPPRTLIMQALNLPPMPAPVGATPPSGLVAVVRTPEKAGGRSPSQRRSARTASADADVPAAPSGEPRPIVAAVPREGARLPTPPTPLPVVPPPASTGGTYPPGYWAGVQGPQATGGVQPARAPTPASTLAVRGVGPLRRKLRPDAPKAIVETAFATLSAAQDARLTLVREPFSAASSSAAPSAPSPRDVAFRELRHRVVERGDPRSLLVTSANDGEGKSTCAVNLAIALAESGRWKVLLLDVNVRKPALAAILGLRPPACFLDQLAVHRQDPNTPWAVVDLQPMGLHVLAIDPAQGELRALHGPTFTAAMDRLRGTYDYVIVDGGSILTGAETALVADSVDGLVFVARAHRTRARQAKKALALFSAADVVGTVLLDA